MLIEVIDHLIILQSKLSAFPFHVGGCALLMLIDVSALYREFQMENRTFICGVFVPPSSDESLLEMVVFIADEYAAFLRQVVPLAIDIPIGNHWNLHVLIIAFHKRF